MSTSSTTTFKLNWDQTGNKLYETGVDRGVLYVQSSSGTYPKGVVWDGITAFSENPSGAEATPLYADNVKYLNLTSAEEYGFNIEAYSSPAEFDECDGSAELAPGVSIGQQSRKTFGFCCRTVIGNDTNSNAHGYKLHLIYGAMASPTERSYSSINESPEAMTLSWECSTTPVSIPGYKPTACIIIDSTKVDAAKLAAFEAILYGSGTTEATLPLPDAVKTHFATASNPTT